MDMFEQVAVHRAHAALQTAIRGTAPREKAEAFIDMAFDLFRERNPGNGLARLQRSTNPLIKAAVAGEVLGGGVFDGPDAKALAASYIASIAQGSVLDQVLRFATKLPSSLGHIVVASGYSANVTTEGMAKAVRKPLLNLATAEPIKVAAIVVLSDALANAIGGSKVFEDELAKAVVNGTNAAVIAALTTTSSDIASTGDALEDLRAAIGEADASEGYVVAVDRAYAVDLATRTENRGGAGVRGGDFAPGISLVVVDNLGAKLVAIPASLIAVEDGGLGIDTTGEASILMSDTPAMPAYLVSAFQENLFAIRCERMFRIASNAPCIVVRA